MQQFKLSLGWVVVIAALAFAIGGFVGRVRSAGGSASSDETVQALALAHELEVTGLCVNALTLVDAQNTDTLSRLLDERMNSALTYSSSLVADGAVIDASVPNLQDSVRRAAAYYESRNDASHRDQAEALLASLTAVR